MELNKFGAILKFAIDMEEQAIEFYEEAAQSAEAFAPFAKESAKRKARLERTRRQMINEMTLEPIADFAADLPEVELAPDTDFSQLLSQALKLERQAQEFYSGAAEKIQIIAPSVSKTFKKLAQEGGKRQGRLSSLDG